MNTNPVENTHRHQQRALRFLARIGTPLAGLAGPLVVAAQGPFGEGYVQGYAPPARDLPGTILGIINVVLILVGVVALAYLVYGGFTYITAAGDSDRVDRAKNIIIYAVIGIVVIGIAAAAVNFVIGTILLGAR